MSILVAAVAGSNTVNRMPRTPPPCISRSSASVTSGSTTATPRALPSVATASSVTRLSVP